MKLGDFLLLKGYINKKQLRALAKKFNNGYGQYLSFLLDD